jgi:hypothetical protein
LQAHTIEHSPRVHVSDEFGDDTVGAVASGEMHAAVIRRMLTYLTEGPMS